VAVNFLRQTIESAAVTRSSFDQSSEAWDLGSGIFLLPPNRIAPTRALAHTGAGSLEATCVTLVAGGCGPYLRLERTFRKDAAYAAAGWINAKRGTRIRLVLGSNSRDVAVGTIADGGGGWTRLSVSWIPKADANLGIAAFQVMSRGTSHFNVDDVEVGPQSAIQRGETPTHLTGYRTIIPATEARALDSGHTAEWAAAGAGAGLLVGIASAGAAAAARRRSRDRLARQERLF
jgi:hypothetical protein